MRRETSDKSETSDERQGGLASHVSRLSTPGCFSLTLKAWPAITLATICLCLVTELVASWFGILLPEQTTVAQMRLMGLRTWEILTTQGLSAAFNDKISRLFLYNVPLVIAVIPLFEECLFRGLFYRLPAAKLPWGSAANRRTFFLILSAALFSAAHYLQAPWPNNAFLALFFFGLAQCWLYEKTGRLWCPMLNHALFNLSNLVLLFVLPVD